uniref:Uncharacterized protein n=1 Tax=Rhizophora mucronata TaxID=61149 RepID=A0A2P2IK71_RHIMU
MEPEPKSGQRIRRGALSLPCEI